LGHVPEQAIFLNEIGKLKYLMVIGLRDEVQFIEGNHRNSEFIKTDIGCITSPIS